jgi:hypothetical protein
MIVNKETPPTPRPPHSHIHLTSVRKESGRKKPREAALCEPAETRNPPFDVPELLRLDVPSSLT